MVRPAQKRAILGTAILTAIWCLGAAPSRGEDIGAVYAADLTRAVAGEKKVPFPITDGFGDMGCAPARIDGQSAATREFVLTLPRDVAARAHVLAVVTPERGLLEVYAPYDGPETDDTVVPSRVVSWMHARVQHRFTARAEALDGLRPGGARPEVLFLEPGLYRFALVNTIDSAVPKAGTMVRVMAACTFHWTP